MYGIKSRGEWLTQGGRIVTSRSAETLAETFTFGEVTRVRGLDRLRRIVDLRDAFRPSEPRTRIHRTTVTEVPTGGMSEVLDEMERDTRTIQGLIESPATAEPLVIKSPLGNASITYEVVPQEVSS